MQPKPAPSYVMGHNDRERRRLMLQASIINPFSEQLLRRAGIAPGMRVLDAGCGVGEMSMIAARLVGRHGGVVGMDIDESALATARQRAEEQGLAQIKFVHGDVGEHRPEGTFDAVIGRHIVIHTPDPAGLLRLAFSVLNRGGVAVFQEYDFNVVHAAYPDSPLRERIYQIFRDFFRVAAHGNAGTRLYNWFVEAGFPAPDCRAEYPISGGPDSSFYEWMAESLRSILPAAERLGLARADEVDIDTLAGRIGAEAVSVKSAFPGPPMIGCFGRKP